MTNGHEEAERGENDERETEPLAWTTIGSDVAYTCPGFSIRHERVRLPNGAGTEFDFLTEPPAVVVLPITSDKKVVLIEEWRQAVGRVNLSIPAGTVEREDTDLETAAHRELREETGYEAGRMTPLTTIEPLNGAADSVHHHFLAEECEPAGDQDLDVDESIRTIETEYETVLDAVRAGEIRDGRAVLAFSYYELLGDR